MNCNERADNMSKRKLFISNLVITKMLEEMLKALFNELIIETTTSQDKKAITAEEDKPFHPSDDFYFPKRKF